MMMENEKLVKKLFKKLQTDYNRDDGFRFPNKNNECELYDDFKDDTLEVLEDKSPLGIAFDILNGMSSWHLRYNQYKIIHENNVDEAKIEFAKSSYYAYLATKKSDEAWGCLPSNEYHLMDLISKYMSQCALCRWDKEADEFAEIMIASINYGIVADENGDPLFRIIENGFSLVPASWFLLELYCKANKRDFNRENAEFPDFMKPYDEVLQKWDTKDLNEVQRLIYIMGDVHLEQSKEEVTDEDYYEFGHPNLWLFPYEILSWLALREKMGLQNPQEYSHPIMNTPLAKMFLEIKEPLVKPTELPYAKELLEKLQERCPNVETDAMFLNDSVVLKDETTNKEQNVIQMLNVPKTGKYRATLPKEHPQSKTLENDPHAYARYEEGDVFSYEGLQEYEIQKIVWVFTQG